MDPGATLAEELNSISARFETSQQSSATLPQAPKAPGAPGLTLANKGVRRVLKAVNPRKATGPDGGPEKVAIISHRSSPPS